jgi:hypothetical protein
MTVIAGRQLREPDAARPAEAPGISRKRHWAAFDKDLGPRTGPLNTLTSQEILAALSASPALPPEEQESRHIRVGQ